MTSWKCKMDFRLGGEWVVTGRDGKMIEKVELCFVFFRRECFVVVSAFVIVLRWCLGLVRLAGCGFDCIAWDGLVGRSCDLHIGRGRVFSHLLRAVF
jgi:hypothetical protein